MGVWNLVSLSIQVLGREVYSSNSQLGGIQIMHNNGVTHITVPSDVEGIDTIIQWLSYVPKVRLYSMSIWYGNEFISSQIKGSPLPVIPSLDPITRPVEFTPTKAPYDPKLMLEGRPGSGMT